MSKVFKSLLSVSAAITIAFASLTPLIVNAWGDSDNGRPSYTIEDINSGKLGDKITFNSISDGKIGDEKNFVGAKVAGTNPATWNNDTINVKSGETYTIRLYVHNNNPKGLEKIAEGVKASFSIPRASVFAKSHTITGYLDSSNASPARYWDEVTLTADENIYLEYVDGSARYTNAKIGTVKLPNEVITSGATLGYDKLDGKIPGCFEYDGVVTIDVKVHSAFAAELKKVVRIKGATGADSWAESVSANVGDEVEYQIKYTNLLSETVNDVMIRDILPTNVEYVPNSTYLRNTNYPNWVQLKDDDRTVVTTGINIGSYFAGGDAYVRFTGKVVDKSLSCGKNQLVNWANVTVSGSSIKDAVYKDDASVITEKTCDVPDPDPNPDPTPTPDPDPTPTPKEFPDTGAGSIATGVIGAGSVVTMLGYYIASRKKLM